ncbi:NUDIX hydrolase [Glycomyces paridis]|nr:NUDIX hydrolase [Glycomyces paridis]
MPITIAHLREQLDAYLDRWPEDAETVAPLLALTGPEGFARSTMPGHVTASAIVLNRSGRVLLVHHKTLDRWLQPGGHVEPTDVSLPQAAMREAVEETGVAALRLADPVPLHVDVHAIPANPSKGEGAHSHYDVRYLFRAPTDDLTPQPAEVHAAEWRPTTDLDDPELTRRTNAAI